MMKKLFVKLVIFALLSINLASQPAFAQLFPSESPNPDVEDELNDVFDDSRRDDDIDEGGLREFTVDVDQLFDPTGENERNPFFSDSTQSPIVSVILRVLNFAIAIFATVSIIMFIVGGFIFMLSEGDEQRVTAAKDVIKYAVISIIVTFLSYTIVIFVQSVFNTA